MKHLNRFFPTLIASLILLSSACASSQSTPAQTNAASADMVPNSTRTVTATSISAACPKINPEIQFKLPIGPGEFEESILNYLNEGGDPTKLQLTTTPPAVPAFYSLAADIDGDSLSEVVLSTHNLFEDPATIRIYHCQQNDYHLAKSFTPQSMSVGIIELVTKVFSSEPSFVIFRGRHNSGWGQDFFAVGWRESEWQIIHLATGTTPSEMALFDQDLDGIKEVFLETKTSATPGGGISRVVIDTYSWNGKEFISIGEAMPPGNDRVHYFEDAERAWKDRNPLLAVAYYEIAARDINLSSYWTTYEFERGQTELAAPYQQAFAYFRIVATWYYLDRPEIASQSIQEMSETFPDGKPGNEFVSAAQELAKWYATDSVFSSACAKAVDLLDTQYPDIVRNHLGDWGIANPMYFSTSDICKLE